MKRQVHLVGSVPLRSSRAVLETCSCILGERVAYLPDGETGERGDWITWQRPLPARCTAMEVLPDGKTFGLRPAHDAPPSFGTLGYAGAALRSWDVFQELRGEGVIPPDQRFQVSLPTPLAMVAQMIEPGSQEACEAPYACALEKELREILAVVPTGDLAMQWDVAIEFAILEGLRPVHFAPAFEGVVRRLRHLLRLVPKGVRLGVHLCYGDAGHEHFKEPEDTALMVRVANSLAEDPGRCIDWIHMPVPRGRDDAAYYRPLRDLRLVPGCRPFLGLVHDEDGLAGKRRRIHAAEPFAPPGFGVATECGLGRRDPATIPRLLRLHVDE